MRATGTSSVSEAEREKEQLIGVSGFSEVRPKTTLDGFCKKDHNQFKTLLSSSIPHTVIDSSIKKL